MYLGFRMDPFGFIRNAFNGVINNGWLPFDGKANPVTRAVQSQNPSFGRREGQTATLGGKPVTWDGSKWVSNATNKDSRPIGTEAILNGQPVSWTGTSWRSLQQNQSERPIGSQATLNNKPVVWDGKSWKPNLNLTRESDNPIKNLLGEIVRSEPVRSVRNALIEPFPFYAQMYIKAMTGGDKEITELPPHVMSAIRTGAALRDDSNAKQKTKNIKNGLIPPNEYSSNVGLYLYNDDARLGLGHVGVWPSAAGVIRPGQNIVIKDEWKVDNDKIRDPKTGVIGDLGEGGKWATLGYDLAKAAGLYEPLKVKVTLTPNQWHSIPLEKPVLLDPFNNSETRSFNSDR